MHGEVGLYQGRTFEVETKAICSFFMRFLLKLLEAKSFQCGQCKTTLSVHKHMVSCEHSLVISYLMELCLPIGIVQPPGGKVSSYKLRNIL